MRRPGPPDILPRLRALPELAGWPEALAYAERAAGAGERAVWSFPLASCVAVGGGEERALLAAAAVFCALASIRLVDDLFDYEPYGEFRRLGAGRAANLALAFQAAGHLLLDTAAAGGAAGARTTAGTARGRDLDERKPADEDGYWLVVGAKTPPLFAAALAMPASADRGRGCGNLAILYATSADHPERAAFLALAAAQRAPLQRLLAATGADMGAMPEPAA